MKIKQAHSRGFVRTAVIGLLCLVAVFTLFDQPGRFPEYVHNYMGDHFGAYPVERAISFMFIGWIIAAYANKTRRKRFYIWAWLLLCWLFLSASIFAIGGVGGGTIAHGIYARVAGLLSTWGLVGITAGLVLIPFQKQITELIKIIADTCATWVNSLVDSIKELDFKELLPSSDASTSADDDIIIDHRQSPALQLFTGGKNATFERLLKDQDFNSDKSLIPIGVAHDSNAHVFESLDTSPHILAGGMTGSGKTVFLQALIAGLASKNSPEDLQLVLIDGVQRGFKPLIGLPHNQYSSVLSETEDVIGALESVVEELDNRINSDQHITTPRIVVVIDEIDDYFTVAKGDKEAAKQKSELETLLTRIAKKGRQFNVNLVMGSQRPSGDLISPHIVRMMTGICLKVKFPACSEKIIDVKDGSKLKGKGDLLCYHDGVLTRAQGYNITSNDMENLCSQRQSQAVGSVGREWSDRSVASGRSVASVVNSREQSLGGRSHESAISTTPTVATDRATTTKIIGFRPPTDEQPTDDQELKNLVLELSKKGMSQSKIAKQIGKGKTWVGDIIRAAK